MGTKQSRRRFTREFKIEAVRQVVEGGRTQKQVADELGLNANLLGRWVKELRDDPEQAFPGNGALKERYQELERLRRENAQLKGELSFLKKVSVRSTGQRNASANTSSGVLNASVFRGLAFSSRAVLLRSA